MDLSGSCPSLDPLTPHLREDCLSLSRLVSSPLMETNLTHEKIETSPLLAQSWILENPTKIRVTLREDLRWSNGAPLHAEHFRLRWNKILNHSTLRDFAPLLFSVKNARSIFKRALPPSELGVQVVDSRTLLLLLEAPDENVLRRLSHPALSPEFAIRPPLAPPTLGPYLKDQSSKKEVSFVVNPLFPGSKERASKITVAFSLNERDRLGRFLDRRTDFLTLSHEAVPSDPSLKEKRLFPSPDSYVLVLNPRKKIFSLREGRRGALAAIHREEIQNLMKWDHRPLNRIYAGDSPLAPWLSETPPKKYSERRANERNFRNDPLPLTLIYSPGRESFELAQNLQAQWEKNFGLSFELVALPPSTLQTGEFDFGAVLLPLNQESTEDLGPLRTVWEKFIAKNLSQTGEYIPYESSLLPWLQHSKHSAVSFEEWLVGKEYFALPLLNLSRKAYLNPEFKGLSIDSFYLWNFGQLSS